MATTPRSEPTILTAPRWRVKKPEIVRMAEGFEGATDVDRAAIVMMLAWGNGDPGSNIAEHPLSYVATFADMARDVLGNMAYIAPIEITEEMVEAAAWAVLDRNMDTADRSPSKDVYQDALADARAALQAALGVRG
jgi:hypothetical protein